MKIKYKTIKNIKIAFMIASLLVISTSLVGCKKGNEQESNTGSSKSNYVVYSINDPDLEESMLSFIKGQLYDGNDYFNAGIAITNDDRYSRVEITEKYSCENAVYCKTHITDGNGSFYCLYRFQMGTNGKIESYIKYVLEA